MAATAESVLDTSPITRPIDLGKPAADARTALPSAAEGGGALFSARGRIGVHTYWARLFGAVLVIALAAGTGGLTTTLVGASTDTVYVALGTGALIALLPALVLSVFWTIQRVHDLELPAAFVLLNLVPVVGTAFSLYASFAPGKIGITRFGTPRPPTKVETFLGRIVLWMVIAFIAMSAYGGFLAGGDV